MVIENADYIVYDELSKMSEEIFQDVLVKVVQMMTPERRREWLMRPIGAGILATTTHGTVRGAGNAAGANDQGPREAVLGRNLELVGWRRGRSGKT